MQETTSDHPKSELPMGMVHWKSYAFAGQADPDHRIFLKPTVKRTGLLTGIIFLDDMNSTRDASAEM